MEFKFNHLGGFKEVAGLHYRGDYDLTCHQTNSGKNLKVKTKEGKDILLNVLEISFGVDRNILAYSF